MRDLSRSAGSGLSSDGRLTSVVRVFAMIVIAVGVVVLIGWSFDLESLTRIAPNLVTMKPTTALLLALLGSAYLLPRLGRLLISTVVAIFAALVVIEYAANVDFGIDGLLFTVPGPVAHPARMAMQTAVCLLLLAMCRLASQRMHRRFVETIAMSVAGLSMLAVLGYLYGVTSLYTAGPLAAMALHTAIALVLLAVAELALVPGGWLPRVVGGQDVGAQLLQRLLPITLVGIPAIGLLGLVGERSRWWNSSFGLAVMVCLWMLLMIGTYFYVARILSRTDLRRQHALNALQSVNHDLENRVLLRAQQLDVERADAAVLRDRQRIAADLHDLVIQRLYAVALGLQAATARSSERDAAERAIDGIDDAIVDLRKSIFELKTANRGNDLLTGLHSAADTVAATLGFEPEVMVSGPVDDIDEAIVPALVAVLREALSNAARHARASSITVRLGITDDDVTLTVADDGVGIDATTVGTSGLLNMRSRASALGGWCAWDPNEPTGTTVVWRVPMHPRGSLDPASGSLAAPRLDAKTATTEGIAAVTRLLLDGNDDDPITACADLIRMLVDADSMAIFTQTSDDRLRVHSGRGHDLDGALQGVLVPLESSLAGHVILTGRPLLISNVRDIPVEAHLGDSGPLAPSLIVPLGEVGLARGAALAFGRNKDRPAFSDADADLATVLGAFAHGALALRGSGLAKLTQPAGRGGRRHRVKV